MTNIAMVEDAGEQETCDLEVDHPDHQFYLTNGILTSNSHAVAYAIDSFWCAWLLTYHEEEWICAYLEAMSTTPEKRAKAFGEVKALGYQIVPIDVNLASVGWRVLPGKRLMPSMTSVKGVGDTAVDELMAMRPIDSVEAMLWNDDGTWRPSKFNKKAMEALVRIRAFDSVGCVGDDKVFASYRHMHHVLFGEHPDRVTRTRKGVEETVDVVVDHAAQLRRSPKKDPHEGRKAFFELARSTRDACPEWSQMELARNQADCFGTVDVTTMFDPKVMDRLVAKGVRSVEDLEPGEEDVVWFVTVLSAGGKKGGTPVPGVMKRTKNRKEYLQAFVTGPVGKPMRLNVWGGKQLMDPFRLCVGTVKRDDYGLSTTTWKVKVVT